MIHICLYAARSAQNLINMNTHNIFILIYRLFIEHFNDNIDSL